MEDLYSKLRSQYFPEKELGTALAQYYGTDAYHDILTTIATFSVVFVVDNDFQHKVFEFFKEKYQSTLDKEDYEAMAKVFLYNLGELITNPNNVYSPIFKENADILDKLGINIFKIVQNDENNKLILQQTEETEKLRKLLNYRGVSLSMDTCDLYNKLATNGVSDFKLNSSLDKKQWIIGLSYDHLSENKVENAAIMKDLDSDAKKTLEVILSAKGDILSWEEEDKEFFVTAINKLFKRSYSTAEEIVNDPTMSIFLEFRNQATVIKDDMEKEVQKTKVVAVTPERSAEIELRLISVMNSTPNMDACTLIGKDSKGRDVKELVYFGHGEFVLKGQTIIHELNHAFANGRTCGGEGLDEIVNEFVTERIVEGLSEEQKKKLNIVPPEERNCAYSVGVAFMRPFLLKFEDKIKMIRRVGTDLSYVFGEKNFATIKSIGEYVRRHNWGRFVNNNGMEITDIAHLANEYSKNPNMQLPDGIREQDVAAIEELLTFQNFLTDLMAAYDAGKDITEPIELRPVSLGRVATDGVTADAI